MSPAFGVAVLAFFALIEIGRGILIRSMATFVSIITCSLYLRLYASMVVSYGFEKGFGSLAVRYIYFSRIHTVFPLEGLVQHEGSDLNMRYFSVPLP